MRVLVIDDQKNIRQAFATAIESANHTVSAASTSAEALKLLNHEQFHAILLDLKLQEESGLDLLAELLRLAPNTPVVIVTAYASIETAVEAMRRGAFDFLAKPCTPEQVRQVLEKIERTRRLQNRVLELETRLSAESPEVELESDSPVMEKVLNIAVKAAASEATVLLLGESGTGKSMLARAMHERSSRAKAPFVTVSCPSLSRELLESELFGHVKGAFTGALAETVGKVTVAEGGTLFLDEIGDLPLEIQAKLLRLLQEKEYERVGDTRSRRADVRIISATNKDLGPAVTEGRFREDLFYRLNVISIQIPPLRDRSVDLPRIAEKQLGFFSRRSGKPDLTFSPEAMQAMRAYSWPGNLRELRNVIERAVILAESDRIEPSDLGDIAEGTTEFRLGGRASLEEIENEHIRKVLANSRTIDEAAHILRIDPATLYRRKKRL
ncbi:MAG: sigma-54-dependent Fis family transcriptional regulator [Verrucomicrobia bacterium]|nr:sigma-54-dependent Fis family transcriptional regulator [Verrucomicrobiota bacterium]